MVLHGGWGSEIQGRFKEKLLLNVIGLLSLMMYCSDWGTDMQQTKTIHDGYKNSSSSFTNNTINGFEDRIGKSD